MFIFPILAIFTQKLVMVQKPNQVSVVVSLGRSPSLDLVEGFHSSFGLPEQSDQKIESYLSADCSLSVYSLPVWTDEMTYDILQDKQ